MKSSRVLLAGALVFIAQLAFGQVVNRYMVFFKNKAGSSFTVSNPSPYLSQKAIARRTKQNISITELDLPVNQSYLQGLRDAGTDVFFKTRWMNGALIECDTSLISNVQALGFVQSVEFVAPNKKLKSGRINSTSKKKGSNSTGALTDQQLHMLGIDEMHLAGFHGEGITIAILDAGFPGVDSKSPFQGLINDNRIDLATSYDFIFNTQDVFQYDSHGTEVLSTLAAYQEPAFTGGAYKANFQLFVTEDVRTEYRIEEFNWLFAAERADSAGADIISTSLGYSDFDDASMNYEKSDLNGKTAVITQAAQFAADRGLLVICSAGNEGSKPWRTITAPADAKGVLAVANVTAFGERSPTSSIGPTSDGRIKPDLAALGTNVTVITPGGSIGSASGTSLAAPLVTGLAAGVWQQYPNLTNLEVMDVLRKTASQAYSPDNFLGYGLPNYLAVTNYFSPQMHVFEVYPNPSTETINIRPKNTDEISACKVQLVNTQGQVLIDKAVEFSLLNRTFTLNLIGISSGIYIVRIWQDNKAYDFKVSKK